METGCHFQKDWNFSKYPILMKRKIPRFWLKATIVLSSCLFSTVANAQVVPDGTTSTTVNVDGNNFEINNSSAYIHI